MEKIPKFLQRTGLLLAVFLSGLVLVPGRAGAEEICAQICVDYITHQNNGEMGSEPIPVEDHEGIVNHLVLPDGEVVTMETDVSQEYSPVRYVLAVGADIPVSMAGVYKLEDIQYPKGYEYDWEAMEEEYMKEAYPLSVTITEEEVESYLKSVKQSWGYDSTFTIRVPVKKIGEPSPLMQPPEKPELFVGYKNTGLSIKNGTYDNEFWYAEKKNGTFRLLDQNNFLDFSDYEQLKDGKVYYFKVRSAKKIRGEIVYGEYSEIKKMKIRKSLVSEYVPVLKIQKEGKKTVLKIFGDEGRGYDIMLYISDRKNGTYRFSTESFSSKVIISDMEELEKGKTYYVKAKYCDSRLSRTEAFYGKFSKAAAVKK